MNPAHKAWTPEDLATLRTFRYLPSLELSERLDRSIHSVRHKLHKLGTYKHKWTDVKGYEHLSEAQRGWIAGILDGEGWIGIDKRSRRGTIQVNNTDTKMIECLKLLCGGRSYLGKKPKNEKWRQQYVWVLSRKANVISLLNSVFPYLTTKREAAIRALKHMGAPVPRCS